MYKGKRILAVITARGGSKGVYKKNIRIFAKKPLIAWTIEEGKKSKFIDRLILSSEDQEIINIAKRLGCEVPFVRPKELSKDNVRTIESIIHAIKTLSEQYDYVVLLQPTSPLRLAEDIDGCIKKCIDRKAPACVSVNKVREHPYLMYYLDDNEFLKPVVKIKNLQSRQRQILPDVFIVNGAVYIAEIEWFLKRKDFLSENTIAYEMPYERSLDIDTEFDFLYGEFLLSAK